MKKLTKTTSGLGSWGSQSSWSRVHMMRSGQSDPLMMVRDNDDREVDNQEQETFVLPAAALDNNIRYEKRSGLGKRPQR